MSRFFLSLVLALSTATTALAAPSQSFAHPPTDVTIEPAITVAVRPAVRPAAEAIDQPALRAKLAANRLANLERFRAYQRAGVFPSNIVTAGQLNVWLDPMGHLCAAATIMKASGQDALVAQVARDNNFIRLATVESGPLLDWILTSGLTQAEIVAIQKPFSGVGRPSPLIGEDPVVVVDTQLRAKENARLARLYKQVEAQIVRNQRASLDAAVARLMKHPELARQLLDV